jgi:SAM-dependent methyltransferase
MTEPTPGPGPGAGPTDREGSLDLRSPSAYGQSFEAVYDTWYAEVTDAEQTAAFVAARHPRGSVLELGVGTGRLAEPLAQRGLSVVGIDASPLMLARRGAAQWAPVQASFHRLPVARGRVGTALLAFNTIFNLTSAAEQADLFREVAALLCAGGSFIVEALDVTDLLTGPRRTVGLRPGTADPVVVSATQLKRSTQQVTGHHLEIDDTGVRVRPWMLRWTTPAQLDAMAADAGLRLVERTDRWDGPPRPLGERSAVDDPGPVVISRYQRH